MKDGFQVTPTDKKTIKQFVKEATKDLVKNNCGATMLIEIIMQPTFDGCNDQSYLWNKKFTAFNEDKQKLTYMKDVSFTGRQLDAKSYSYGFLVTTRYSTALDLCLVYRTNAVG